MPPPHGARAPPGCAPTERWHWVIPSRPQWGPFVQDLGAVAWSPPVLSPPVTGCQGRTPAAKPHPHNGWAHSPPPHASPPWLRQPRQAADLANSPQQPSLLFPHFPGPCSADLSSSGSKTAFKITGEWRPLRALCPRLLRPPAAPPPGLGAAPAPARAGDTGAHWGHGHMLGGGLWGQTGDVGTHRVGAMGTCWGTQAHAGWGLQAHVDYGHVGDMGTCWGLGAQMRAMGTQWGH